MGRGQRPPRSARRSGHTGLGAECGVQPRRAAHRLRRWDARCDCGTRPPVKKSARRSREHPSGGGRGVQRGPGGTSPPAASTHGAAVGRGHRPPDRPADHRPPEHGGRFARVWSVAFSPDGQRIVSAGADHMSWVRPGPWCGETHCAPSSPRTSATNTGANGSLPDIDYIKLCRTSRSHRTDGSAERRAHHLLAPLITP